MSRLHSPLSLLLLSLLSADASSPSEKPNLRSKSLILVKIGCLIVVFVGTFAGGISPYFMKCNEGFLVLGTQFAGGVFLGTAMMHFLSDSNETFGDLTDKAYPFAFMLACSGYLLTMLADFVIAHVYGKRRSGSDGDVEVQGTEKGSSNGRTTESQYQVPDGTENHFVKAPLTTATTLGDSILLIVALCFHSVFEGIAIGVAETDADAWRALWTVCLHKIFAAIAMGIALLRMIPDRPLLSCAAYAFAFAISSPIGVTIGIIIDATTQGVVADWIYAIAIGLACGIFIYVYQSSPIQGLQAPKVGLGRHAPLQVLGCLVGCRSDRCCDDLGYLKRIMFVFLVYRYIDIEYNIKGKD